MVTVRVRVAIYVAGVFSVWMQLMATVRVRVAIYVAGAYSVWTQFKVPTGKRSEHPRGMPLLTRMAAIQAERRREAQWHPLG
jgi:hypothetical protein